MNKMNRFGAALLVPVLALGVAACDDDDPVEPRLGTIVELAQDAGNFTTLVDAVTAAGLAGTLEGDGPFTVFGPTDAAFAGLPAGTLDALLADQARLTAVLTYHVVAGEFDAEAALQAGVLETVNGQELLVTEQNGTVFVDGVPVVDADLRASNGVIHAIGSVLLPAEQNVVEIAQESGGFETLVAALVEAELAGVLAGDGPFTVFAPDDDAFAALPEGTVDDLLADQAALTDVLTYHVVPGRLLSPEVLASGTLTTLQGGTLDIEVVDGEVLVNGATVTAVDIQGTNGVIHVIDGVLVPGS